MTDKRVSYDPICGVVYANRGRIASYIGDIFSIQTDFKSGELEDKADKLVLNINRNSMIRNVDVESWQRNLNFTEKIGLMQCQSGDGILILKFRYYRPTTRIDDQILGELHSEINFNSREESDSNEYEELYKEINNWMNKSRV